MDLQQSQVPEKRKLKILCMHGIGTNKQFMKMQTTLLRKDLQAIAELIYVNGPYQFPIQMVRDPKVVKNLVGQPYSWFNFRTSHKTRAPEEMAAQHETIKRAIEAGSDSYDGALCFSQGSFAFQFVLWEHAKGLIRWPVIEKMKFFINFSADTFRISLKSIDFKRFQIPSLHFLSEQDFLFNRCIVSPTLYKNPEIIYHSFGHRFPVLGIREKQQLRNFLKRHGFGWQDQTKQLNLSRL